MNKIEIIVLDPEGYVTTEREFDFMKDARKWVKEAGLSKAYWNNRGDSETDYDGWAARNVHTLQLMKNGECVEDWFPEFK